MSTDAQIAANQQNAQHSTGPASAEGKSISALNHLAHGLTGSSFSVLPWEDEADFHTLHSALQAQLEPRGPFERLIVEKMAQHQWLAQRALVLQETCFDPEAPGTENDKKLALYLRYQTTHDRAYHKYFDQLMKFRAERRRAEIGFESQKADQADQARKQEAHEARTRLAHAKAAHLELDTEIRGTVEAPLPGNVEIPFDRLKAVLSLALTDVARHMAIEKAAA